jgi:hypothetical protein
MLPTLRQILMSLFLIPSLFAQTISLDGDWQGRVVSEII